MLQVRMSHSLRRCAIQLGMLFALGLSAGFPASSFAQGSSQPRFVEDDAEESSLEGKKALDFTLQTLDGKTVTLSKLKGKVVLIDFWASWCSPCRKSMPHLEATWQKYKDKGLVIVGINVDKEQDKAIGFLSKLAAGNATLPGTKLSYPMGLDSRGKVMGQYEVMQMPTAFVIGKDGVVKKRIVGFSDAIAAETDALLTSLLK